MSTYIGKNNSNQNILHMTSGTRSAAELKSGLLNDTVFHSQRPYLTVASYQNGSGQYIPRIGTYMPEYINDDSSKGYAVDYQDTDGIELMTYAGGSGLIDISKPFIAISKVYTQEKGWIYTLGNTLPVGYNMQYTDSDGSANRQDVLYNINTFSSNSEIEVRISFYNSGTYDTVTWAGSKTLVPSEIILIQLEHDITNFDSTVLNGPINIAGATGVSVGATNFFSSAYLSYSRNSIGATNYYVPVPKYSTDTSTFSYWDMYICLSYVPNLSNRVSIDLKSSSISSNGVTIFDSSHKWIKKVSSHVKSYSITSSTQLLNTFETKYYNEFIIQDVLNGVGTGHYLAIDLTTLFSGFSALSKLAVMFKIQWSNAPTSSLRYKTISGVYTLNVPYIEDSYDGNYDYFEVSGMVSDSDGHIHFIFNTNDSFVKDGTFNHNGNIALSMTGNTPDTTITNLTGWIAELNNGT